MQIPFKGLYNYLSNVLEQSIPEKFLEAAKSCLHKEKGIFPLPNHGIGLYNIYSSDELQNHLYFFNSKLELIPAYYSDIFKNYIWSVDKKTLGFIQFFYDGKYEFIPIQQQLEYNQVPASYLFNNEFLVTTHENNIKIFNLKTLRVDNNKPVPLKQITGNVLTALSTQQLIIANINGSTSSLCAYNIINDDIKWLQQEKSLKKTKVKNNNITTWQHFKQSIILSDQYLITIDTNNHNGNISHNISVWNLQNYQRLYQYGGLEGELVSIDDRKFIVKNRTSITTFNLLLDLPLQAGNIITLLELLQSNHSVTELNLSGIVLSKNVCLALVKLFKENNTLEVINLSSTKLTNIFAKQILGALQSNLSTKVVYINVDNNPSITKEVKMLINDFNNRDLKTSANSDQVVNNQLADLLQLQHNTQQHLELLSSDLQTINTQQAEKIDATQHTTHNLQANQEKLQTEFSKTQTQVEKLSQQVASLPEESNSALGKQIHGLFMQLQNNLQKLQIENQELVKENAVLKGKTNTPEKPSIERISNSANMYRFKHT